MIRSLTEERESEYTKLVKYTLFVGTWNVNGQMSYEEFEMKTHFLSCDAVAPDFFAIGFQELDLSKEAFIFNDDKKVDHWTGLCKRSLPKSASYVLLDRIRLIGKCFFFIFNDTIFILL